MAVSFLGRYFARRTTFMLHGARVRDRGSVCAPSFVSEGGDQTLFFE
jgi:hypothetical protein